MRDIKQALIALKVERFERGAAWARAHELAQQHEGTAAYDHLHAVLHRIEGDQPNAAYWYRRARKPVFAGDVAEEVELLIGAADWSGIWGGERQKGAIDLDSGIIDQGAGRA